MRAVLKVQINKTGRNDARGIAQMMRAGLYRPVHVKTLRSQKLRMESIRGARIVLFPARIDQIVGLLGLGRDHDHS